MAEKFLNTSGRHRFLINFLREGEGEKLLALQKDPYWEILRHSCLSDFPPKTQKRVRGKHTATKTVANKQKSTTTTIGKHANDCNSCCCCCCGSYYGYCCAETRERAIKMRGQNSQTYVVTREVAASP